MTFCCCVPLVSFSPEQLSHCSLSYFKEIDMVAFTVIQTAPVLHALSVSVGCVHMCSSLHFLIWLHQVFVAAHTGFL